MKTKLLALAICLSATACYNPFSLPPSQPTIGDHQLPIGFQHWIYPGACSAADISMWVKYRWTPYPAEQQDIIDYMYFWYPFAVGPDGSLSVEGIETALWEYSFIPTQRQFYVGDDDKRRAVADMKKGISVGNPTIVITDSGLHAKMVKGASWQQLANFQPSVDYITTADPANYAPTNDTVAYFLQYVGNADFTGTFMDLVETTGQHYSALDELADYDNWGGTYYGDETPSDGCDDCPPLEAGLLAQSFGMALKLIRPGSPIRASLTSSRVFGSPASFRFQQPSTKSRSRPVGPGQQRNHAVRRYIYVPNPHAHRAGDVKQNLLAALQQTKLREVEGWEDLDALLAGHRISVTAVEHVDSLSRHPEYWLLSLRADGQSYARALVSEEGWLLSVMRVPPSVAIVEPASASWAATVAASEGYPSAPIRRVHMYNNLTLRSGSAGYDPFFEITAPGRDPIYVAEDGSVYRLDSAGSGVAFWRDGKRHFTRIR